MVLYSHRCLHSTYGENSIEGCRKVVEYGFTGIEVDVQYYDSKFYIHHDHWYLANNQTLRQLLELNLGVDLWVDMKTSYVESIDKFIPLVENFTNRLLVEVYDEKMIAPLKSANITVSSTYMDTDFRSVWGLNYLLFGADKSPHGTWQMDILCWNDAYLADGGEIVVTDFYKPSSCDTYFSILFWRVVLWIIIFTFLLSVGICFYRVLNMKERKRDSVKRNTRTEYASINNQVNIN